eukprot:5741782-Pyramimonas_sp.AAC.1
MTRAMGTGSRLQARAFGRWFGRSCGCRWIRAQFRCWSFLRERLALDFCEATSAVTIATMLLGFFARRPILAAVAGTGAEAFLGSSVAV